MANESALPRRETPGPAATVGVLPPPQLLRPVSVEDALKINAAVPLAGGVTPARPFRTDTGKDALDCLTQAIYYEAGSEPVDGQRAVAQVVLNRVRHPAFPASVCGVVYQGSERATGCQFTFTCDGSLTRAPARWAWDRARKVAEQALDGAVYAPVGTATHYHTNWVVPYWASSVVKSAVVGTHIFYRWSGGWGRPGAFTQRYAGREASAARLRSAALAALASHPAAATSRLAEKMESDPLLKLVEVKPGAGGTGERVTLRIGSPNKREVTIPADKPYADRDEVSANLRWTLKGGESSEQPLGQKPGATGTVTAQAQ